MKEILAYPANYWQTMYEIWLIVSVIIYLVVFIPGAYFLFKYRYKKGVNEKAQHVHESKALEILWTIIACIPAVFIRFSCHGKGKKGKGKHKNPHAKLPIR